MKGLILCAGKGTRLQPFSYSQPKTLIPVVNKPVLEYCIENLTKQGIVDIGIVINPYQEVIPQKIGNGERFEAKIEYIYQLEQKGISHAVKQAEKFIGEEPFILMLGDNLIAENLQTLIDSYEQGPNKGSILLAPVEHPQEFGIAEIRGNEIVNLEEKPKRPKSNLAVIGAYLFDSIIFEAVNEIAPSSRGEYEITDAILWILKKGHKIAYSITKEMYSDVGTLQRWMNANQWMMAKHFNDQIVLGKNTIVENCTLRGPLIVGEGCVLRNATIGPFVSIEKDCSIENCKIEHSIILENTMISNIQSMISNSVIGREVVIKGKGGNGTRNSYLQLSLGDKTRMESIEGEYQGDDR